TGISRFHIEAIGNRVFEEGTQALLLNTRNPGDGTRTLEARGRTEEQQALDPVRMVDGNMLGDVSAGRIAEQVGLFDADGIEEFAHVPYEPIHVQLRLR